MSKTRNTSTDTSDEALKPPRNPDPQPPDQEIFDALTRMAQGDLTFRINGAPTTGEDRQLLHNLDGLARRLRYIVGRLQRAAESIETVVGEVLRGTQTLSAGVIDEAKSVEETSSSISEINASMHSVGGSLGTLSNLSQSTSTSVMEMATSINQVSENADELAQFVEETASAIEEMAVSIRKVAESTEALAESAEKTAGAMEAIDSSTRSIGESVNETTVLSDEVARSADAGSQVVADTAASMSNIKGAIDAATETITRLGRRSEQIGEVTHVINEIADRTHLLALNAAILAAQAGTQGRGFRIVADEIKELSERTAASTREIEDMIKAVREEVAEAIERATSEQALTSRHIGERALHMSELTEQVRRATGEQAQVSKYIAQAMEELTMVVEQIRQASNEQSAGTDQVLRAIETIKEVVGRNQASISGINSAVDLLVREAELLNREVEAFSLPVAERGGHLRFALRTSQLALDPA
ncbi:MAG TPA: methyl-accepting chemotaxis protein, partial [Blastocatellia bacterium]